MILSITGSRSIIDYDWFVKELEKELFTLPKIEKVISGGAKGTDSLAKKYCTEHKIEIKEILPNWNKYGKGAGLIRNKDILNETDFNLIFWDGNTHHSGTKFNIDFCMKYNKKFKVIKYEKVQ